MLENGDLNLRISTGEVIALIYESGREIDDDFDGYIDGLHDLLKELATDSSKYRAKREKKQQKSTFRDILKTVEVSNENYEKCFDFIYLSEKCQFEIEVMKEVLEHRYLNASYVTRLY